MQDAKELDSDPTRAAPEPRNLENGVVEALAINDAGFETPPSDTPRPSVILSVVWSVAVVAGLVALLFWKLP
jgi:hypothetical protein